uniref:Uncharacterized protein n=1 Tax=viral metagenome TaxID=1070528 RepID=A0A6H1ZIH3_9ZZZZ
MATTYCTDADITGYDSDAVEFLPPAEVTFDRVRGLAYAEIGRRLARREPAIDQGALGLIDGLSHAEVLYSLYRLYFESAAKVGDMDTLRWRADEYRKAFEDEIACVRIPADLDDYNAALRSVKCVPIYRR